MTYVPNMCNTYVLTTPSSRASLLVSQVTIKRWKVYVDSVSNARGSRIGVVLVSPEGVRLEKSLKLGFTVSNNEAEYEALIVGLRVAQKLGVEELDVFSDSRLVVN